MAKLNRESKLRQKRVEKAARKDARKLAAANPEPEHHDVLDDDVLHDDVLDDDVLPAEETSNA